jgi:succinoglycan biosynthesis protein ExoA
MLARVSETLEKSGADCLGRPQPLEMTDAAPLQWAVASARRSRLGHHPDSFIYSDQARFAPASSVAVAYRKSVFETVGLFDETFDACEDVEMNTRIDAAGLKCYFEPAIAVRYVPRKTLKGLAYQMFRYGRGRVRLFRKHRHTFSWSGFAPGLFVFGVMSGLPLCFVHWIFLWTYFGVCGLYFAAIIAESLRLTIQQKRADILFRLPFVFLAVHFGYGWGILREWRFALSPR